MFTEKCDTCIACMFKKPFLNSFDNFVEQQDFAQRLCRLERHCVLNSIVYFSIMNTLCNNKNKIQCTDSIVKKIILHCSIIK